MYQASQCGYAASCCSGSFGSSYGGSSGNSCSSYSPLESMAANYAPSTANAFYSAVSAPAQSYSFSAAYTGSSSHSNSLAEIISAAGYSPMPAGYTNEAKNNFYNLVNIQPEYHFIPDNFLKPGKDSIFVGKAEEIKAEVEKAFELIFNSPFPKDIKLSILEREEFRKLAPSPGVIGLSINRGNLGLLSEIFVLNDSIGRVMLTIGHELGHVLTPTLEKAHDEEAKAYAFSLIWMKTIKEHNICSLAEAIILESPAQNGLHNVAFEFVHKMMREGREEGEIYEELKENKISVAI